MNLPLVSIVIPCYNSEKYILETISSWLNQSYTNIEIIVQDDASKDNTWELLIRNFTNHKQVKIFRNNENLGIGENWNKGYEKVNGQYCVIGNADDIVFEDFVDKALNKFEIYPSISFVCCTAMRRDEKLEKDIWNINDFRDTEGIFNNFTKTGKSVNRLMAWQFTLAKTASLEQLKENGRLFFPTQCCDADLWLRAHQKNMSAYYIETVCGYYRTHAENNSSIPFGEFNSTFLHLAPRHTWHFKSKFHINTLKKIKTLSYYILYHLRKNKKLKIDVIQNFIKFNFSL